MSRVLLGVTGSVAAVRTPDVCRALQAAGHEVRIAVTNPALAFFDLAGLGETRVYRDQDEWPEGRLFQVGEPVLHIELRKWAEALVIAPLDANTLAKLALGLCDNLLTCVYRAWDPFRPVVLAPAMNTLMWEHPATARHLRRLAEDYGGHLPPGGQPEEVCEAINAAGLLLRAVSPQSKRLACGDEGMGGMADVAAIVAQLQIDN